MRLHFHGGEVFEYSPVFAFTRVPEGVYMVRTTVEPTDGEYFEAYDFQWPVLLRDGTLTALEVEIPRPHA